MSAPHNQKVLVSHELRIDTRTKLGEGEAEGCPRRELYLGRRCGNASLSGAQRLPLQPAGRPAHSCSLPAASLRPARQVHSVR